MFILQISVYLQRSVASGSKVFNETIARNRVPTFWSLIKVLGVKCIRQSVHPFVRPPLCPVSPTVHSSYFSYTDQSTHHYVQPFICPSDQSSRNPTIPLSVTHLPIWPFIHQSSLRSCSSHYLFTFRSFHSLIFGSTTF